MLTASRLSRTWDGFDAYLFDIDGTLLNCRDAVHYFAFCDALTAVAGRPLNLDGVVTHGNVDGGILRDALLRAEVDEALWRGALPTMCERIGAQVEANQGQMEIEVLHGASAVLEHLRTKGAVLSTATGNLARVGEAKLARCGLLSFFQLGGYSDGCDSRAEVFRRAVEQVRRAVGEGATVCVVGDTPADVHAAHANGLEVIAVATGIFTVDELRASEPELCVSTLEELPGQSAAPGTPAAASNA